jgi:hypothetical protein
MQRFISLLRWRSAFELATATSPGDQGKLGGMAGNLATA